jgi:hypothetical protein
MDLTKLGRTFDPSNVSWISSHAQIPVPRQISEDVYRIYFAGRNEDNMSCVGYVDVNITKPTDPIRVSKAPVLELGSLGAFDDSGVFPHCIVNHTESTYLYYTGWMRGDRVNYYAGIGLAKERKDGTFKRVSQAPVVHRTNADPFLMHSPYVLREDNTWKMWYSSATMWQEHADGIKPHYNIRYTESNSGESWHGDGTVAIDFSTKDEWALARPYVLHTETGYEMWYCYSRPEMGYRIGFATSKNGHDWKRQDELVQLNPSSEGWDSDMVGYPSIIDHGDRTLLFYNGSEFGKQGFGVAEVSR